MELGNVTIGLSKRGHGCKVLIDCHCSCVLVDKIHFRVLLGSDNIQNTLIEENILVLLEKEREKKKKEHQRLALKVFSNRFPPSNPTHHPTSEHSKFTWSRSNYIMVKSETGDTKDLITNEYQPEGCTSHTAHLLKRYQNLEEGQKKRKYVEKLRHMYIQSPKCPTVFLAREDVKNKE